MPKVPVIKYHEKSDALPDKVGLVTSVEVGRSTHAALLHLDIGVYHFARHDGHVYQFALSPAAAAQLARALQEEVEAYLYSAPDDETG